MDCRKINLHVRYVFTVRCIIVTYTYWLYTFSQLTQRHPHPIKMTTFNTSSLRSPLRGLGLIQLGSTVEQRINSASRVNELAKLTVGGVYGDYTVFSRRMKFTIYSRHFHDYFRENALS